MSATKMSALEMDLSRICNERAAGAYIPEGSLEQRIVFGKNNQIPDICDEIQFRCTQRCAHAECDRDLPYEPHTASA